MSDVNLRGADQELMRGGYKGNAERMQKALDDGASAVCVDVVGRTPLHFAGAHGLRSVAERLLAGGADVNAQDYGGYTALHLATCYMRMDTVRALLDAGADPNKATYEGAGEGRLAVEIAEELVAATPERKIFGFELGKEERAKRLELYELLDRVTEVEEDEEEAEDERARLERAAKALEGGDGTTVVVRKKSVEAPKVNIDDAQVKVTVKSTVGDGAVANTVEPAASPSSSPTENNVVAAEEKPAPQAVERVMKSDDAEVTIRTRKASGEPRVIDDSQVKVTIRVKGKTE